MQKKPENKNLIQLLLLSLCCVLTIAFPKIFGSRGYYLAAFLFALIAVAMVFISFEKSGPDSLKLTVTSVLCALGIGGRMVFAGVPFVHPVAAVVIISGASLGPQTGFLTGAVIMLVSNFMFGQGPWTVWQMLAFGIMGLLSGIIFYNKPKLCQPSFMALFGLLCYVLITGPILDLSGIFAYTMPGKVSLVATLLAGLGPNITGGISTVLFLTVLAKPVLKKLNRLKKKYGL